MHPAIYAWHVATCGVFYGGKHAGKSWQQNGKSCPNLRRGKIFVRPHHWRSAPVPEA
jgi:hypothetical protein